MLRQLHLRRVRRSGKNNAVGSLQRLTLPNGVETVYTYDFMNRLDSETVRVSANGPLLQSYAYTYSIVDTGPHVHGQRRTVQEQRYVGGILSDTRDLTYTFDLDGRLVVEVDSRGGPPITTTYAYDLAGNRVKKVQGGVTTVYSYNTLDQLTAEGPDADADGVPDAAAATRYAYDDNGSMTDKTVGEVTQHYDWDLRGRLVGFDGNGDNDTLDAEDVNYGYDSQGQRTRFKNGSNATTFLLNDKNNPTGYPQVLEEGGVQRGRK